MYKLIKWFQDFNPVKDGLSRWEIFLNMDAGEALLICLFIGFLIMALIMFLCLIMSHIQTSRYIRNLPKS